MRATQTFSLIAGLVLVLAAQPASSASSTGPLILDLSKFQREKFVTDGKTNEYWQTVLGRQVFDGLPFLIAGRGCVYGTKMGPEQRGGTNTCPDLIGIPVGRKFDELHLLHVTQYADLEGREIARIRLNYADGSQHEFPILFGGHVRDWNRMIAEEKELLTDPATKIVWRAPGIPRIKSTLRLFKTMLANPHPEKEVATIDVVSSKHLAAYDLIAATVANRDRSRPVTPPVPSDEPERKFDGTLTVKVTEETSDRPVAGAVVDPSLKFEDGFQDGMPLLTSDKGEAIIRFPAGRTARIAVMVDKEGYNNQRAVAKLENSAKRNLRVKLPRAQMLTGLVQDGSGAPVSGVTVVAWPDWRTRSKVATTDAAGRFALTWHPQRDENANVDILLIARDLKGSLALAQPIDEGTTNIELRLKPGLTLAGRATDPKGNALTNATAEVILIAERTGASLGKPVPSDKEGRFEIKALPTGQRYHVSVTAKGYGSASRSVDQEAEGPRLELEPCALPVADQRLAGVVLDARDRPVTNATVYGYGEEQPRLTAKTDKQGRFSFSTACAGQIMLTARTPNGRSGSASAQGSDTNITIQIGVQEPYGPSRGSSKITGQVTDADGKPVPQARVCLFPSWSQAEKQTDAEGRFSLTYDPRQGGPMGESAPIVVAREVGRNLAAAVDLEEGVTNTSVRLQPALTLAGRITDPVGKALTNAQARLWFHTERMASDLGAPVRANSEGQFEIKALPQGRQYTVNASARGFGQEQRNVPASDTETNRINLGNFELPRADQRIAGVVLDDDDKPVARASIYSYGDKQPNQSAQTDAKGQFSMSKVCAGPIQLSANNRSGGYGNMTAEGGDTNIVIRISTSRVMRTAPPPTARLKGKPLPDLAPLGLTAAEAPADQPLLAVLIDAEQRPSRRALRVLTEQAAALKAKGVAVIVIQAGAMAEQDFKAWKQEAALPLPIGSLPGNAEKTRAAWGAGALPWLILTDKAHHVTAEGFALEELDAKVNDLAK